MSAFSAVAASNNQLEKLEHRIGKAHADILVDSAYAIFGFTLTYAGVNAAAVLIEKMGFAFPQSVIFPLLTAYASLQVADYYTKTKAYLGTLRRLGAARKRVLAKEPAFR